MRSGGVALMTILWFCGTANLSFGQNGPGTIRWRAEEDGTVPRAQPKEKADAVLEAARNRRLVLQFDDIPGADEKVQRGAGKWGQAAVGVNPAVRMAAATASALA